MQMFCSGDVPDLMHVYRSFTLCTLILMYFGAVYTRWQLFNLVMQMFCSGDVPDLMHVYRYVILCTLILMYFGVVYTRWLNILPGHMGTRLLR